MLDWVCLEKSHKIPAIKGDNIFLELVVINFPYTGLKTVIPGWLYETTDGISSYNWVVRFKKGIETNHCELTISSVNYVPDSLYT